MRQSECQASECQASECQASEGQAFEGIENFRDFGGAASAFGGRVCTGRLFRSAHLGAASEQDLQALAHLGVSTVVDLRRPTERSQQPSRWSGFPGRLICSDEGDRAEGPHVEFLRQGDLSDAGVEAYLSGYYRQAPFEPRHLALFSQAFEALDAGDGAMLVHCTAGKDRTGLLAALIQRALGVSPEDIMDDYLLTNRATMTPARRARVSAALTPMIGREPSEAILLGFMGVSARHLDLAFGAIATETGGLDGYLAGLGAGTPRLERLRARLLV